MNDKIIVTNLGALKKKYGATGLKKDSQSDYGVDRGGQSARAFDPLACIRQCRRHEKGEGLCGHEAIEPSSK